VALALLGVTVSCGARSGLMPGEQEGSVGNGAGRPQQSGTGSAGGSLPVGGGSGAGGSALDCRGMDCIDKDLDCAPGSHPDTLPNECCPSCVIDEPPPCDQAQVLYYNYRKSLLVEYASRGCTASGCASFVENNRCTITCGTLIPAQWSTRIEEELMLFAEETCSSCPEPQVPACLPWPPFSCFLDSCSLDSSHG
jgi:hypothetical protein